MDVRFTAESGHQLSALGCPLSAKSGHYAVQQKSLPAMLSKRFAGTPFGPLSRTLEQVPLMM
jgi:hypothetical protein